MSDKEARINAYRSYLTDTNSQFCITSSFIEYVEDLLQQLVNTFFYPILYEHTVSKSLDKVLPYYSKPFADIINEYCQSDVSLPEYSFSLDTFLKTLEDKEEDDESLLNLFQFTCCFNQLKETQVKKFASRSIYYRVARKTTVKNKDIIKSYCTNAKGYVVTSWIFQDFFDVYGFKLTTSTKIAFITLAEYLLFEAIEVTERIFRRFYVKYTKLEEVDEKELSLPVLQDFCDNETEKAFRNLYGTPTKSFIVAQTNVKDYVEADLFFCEEKLSMVDNATFAKQEPIFHPYVSTCKCTDDRCVEERTILIEFWNNKTKEKIEEDHRAWEDEKKEFEEEKQAYIDYFLEQKQNIERFRNNVIAYEKAREDKTYSVSNKYITGGLLEQAIQSDPDLAAFFFRT